MSVGKSTSARDFERKLCNKKRNLVRFEGDKYMINSYKNWKRTILIIFSGQAFSLLSSAMSLVSFGG